MKNKNLPIIIGIVLVLLVGTVSANEIPTVSSEGFNLLSWLKHTFNLQDFTIVGQDRSCDVYVKSGNTLYFNHGELMGIKSSDGGCSYALIDVFNQNWNPIGEWKDNFNAYCGSTSCIVEIYCCPHPECTSNSQCEDWEGTGSECKTHYEVDSYMPLKDENHNIINSYKYCTASCTGSEITCWRIESEKCASRTYNCGYETYPNCPTTYKYTSKSECENNLCTPNCAGKECGADGCGGSCGTCSGETCENGLCVSGEMVCSTINNQADCESNNCEWKTSWAGFKAECVDKSSNGNGGCPTYTKGECSNFGERKCFAGDEYVYSCSGIDGLFCWDPLMNCVSENKVCVDGYCVIPGVKSCTELTQTECAFRTDCMYTASNICKTIQNAECSGKTETECSKGNECEWTGTKCQFIDIGNGATSSVSTITWTEFYSIDDDKFSKTDCACKTTADCPLKEDYTVTCSDDQIFKDRTFKVYKEACDKGFGFIDEIIYGSLYIGSLGLVKADICGQITKGKTAFESWFKGGGTCLAESDKWYGGLWEGALKLVGGMGFPTQYVMIITLMILITLIGIIVRMFT